MKRNIFLLLLLSSCLRSYAQTLNDSFINARDYVAARLVEASIVDLVNPKDTVSVRKDVMTFDGIENLLSTNSLLNPIGLHKLSSFLIKNGYEDKPIRNIFIPAVYNITPGTNTDRKLIPIELINRIYAIPYYAIKNEECQRIKDSLLADLNCYFTGSRNVKSIDEIKQSTSIDSSRQNSSLSHKEVTDPELLAQLNDTGRANIQSNGIIGNSEDTKYNAFYNVVGPIGIALLIIGWILILVKILRYKGRKNKSTLESKVTNTIIKFDVSNDDQFYMGIPTNQGFESKNMSPVYDKNTSVFIFTKNKNNKKTASYKAIIGEFTLQLLKNNSHNENLKNACFFTGDPIEKSSTFVTIEEGNAIYDREKWLIVRKTRICFGPSSHSNKNENLEAPQGQNTSINIPIHIEESKSTVVNEINDKTKKEIKPSTDRFYLGFPIENGFPESLKTTEYDKRKSIFLFTYNQGSIESATFELLNDHETFKFLNNKNNVKELLAFCSFNEVPNSHTSSFVTAKKGEVKLRYGRWYVISKAQIITISYFDQVISQEKDKQIDAIRVSTQNETPKTIPALNVELNIKKENRHSKLHSTTSAFEKQPVTEKEIASLLKGLVENAHSTQQSNNQVVDKELKGLVENIQPTYVRFYMGIPDKNFFLKDSKLDVYKPGITVFEFLHDTSKHYAEFKIISDNETIKLVRNNYLQVINNACESINTASIHTSIIITLSKGLAVMNGDKWKISEKSIIKFEENV